MKLTNYILAALFTMVSLSPNAQTYINDDMESYIDGFPIFQDHWISWTGTDIDAGLASSNQAHSGALSYYIDGNGTIDGVLDLDNQIFGLWSVDFWAYIPTGKMGYFNIQAGVPVIPSWCGEFYFNRDGTTIGAGEVVGFNATTFDFPHDQWFQIFIYFDLSAGMSLATWSMDVDGTNILSPGTLFVDTNGDIPDGLGGLNFSSAHADCEFYIDDVRYKYLFLGKEDFDQIQFKAHPNPVNNFLTVEAKESIRSISIYNTLGQLMYSEELNALTTQIDMSHYKKGIYFVNVTIGKTQGTVKIIK